MIYSVQSTRRQRVSRPSMAGALVWALLGLLCYGVDPSRALAQEDGRAIAQKIYDRDDGKTAQVRLEMLLIDKQGSERARTMVTYAKDYGKLSKRYTRFLTPASINGTGFLSWENEYRSDDQFLYLPELGRVRRVVSGQKDQSFVNSDFTYEDLEKRKVDKDTHTLLRSEPYRGSACWVLESIPRDASESQYGRIVAWVVQDLLMPAKVEYYSKNQKLIKTLLVNSFEKKDGIWTAMESVMFNQVKNHRTVLRILDISYNKSIDDRVFTEENMQRPQ